MPVRIPPLSLRILSRLETAEAQEPDLWLRDDLRIARLTVIHAARGDAVECSPEVLASYEVLGLHPEKVWPAILAQRNALGPLEATGAPPKKPAQSVKLWAEKTKGARAVNSRAGEEAVLRGPRLLPMATASIAALYPNSDAVPSAKKAAYTYQEWLAIVKFSGAPHSVRQGTLNALTARGPWPERNGAAHGIVCVSLDGMMLGNEEGAGNVVRSTARWRARRAVKLNYWRHLRTANSWSNCRKCGAERKTGKCEKCGYVGRAKTPEGRANFDEFCRPHMYEIDIEKFLSAPRPKGIRHFDARTYAEHKEAAKRGEHPNVIPMKPAAPTQPPLPPAPAAPKPERAKPAAHRSTERAPNEAKPRQLTSREGPRLVNEMRRLMRGYMGSQTGREGALWIGPEHPQYREPMSQENALTAACINLAIPETSAREFLKLLPRGDLLET